MDDSTLQLRHVNYWVSSTKIFYQKGSGHSNSILFPVVSTYTTSMGSILFPKILCAVFIIEPLRGKTYLLGFRHKPGCIIREYGKRLEISEELYYLHSENKGADQLRGKG